MYEREKQRLEVLEKLAPSHEDETFIHISVTEDAEELWERIWNRVGSLTPTMAMVIGNEIASMDGPCTDKYLFALSNVTAIQKGLERENIFI